MESELTTFASYGRPDQSPRNWSAALLGSLTVYIVAIVVIVGLASWTRQAVIEKRVDLTFVEKIVKLEPPAPSIPDPASLEPPKPAAAAAPAAAPVIRPDQKIRRIEKPPPPKELIAPREMPKEVPKEAAPSEDKGVAVYGDPGKGDPAGLEGGMQAGVVGGKVGVIELPPDAIAPRPLASNARPRYPKTALRRDKSGKVKLQLAVYADGSAGEITVLNGEEPFASAAKDAVARWRFEPARLQGEPISTYARLEIIFELTE